MKKNPFTNELAQQARKALEENPMTSHERWEFLIREGIIDREGRVLCSKLFGDDSDREKPHLPSDGKERSPRNYRKNSS